MLANSELTWSPAQIRTPVYKTFGMSDKEIEEMWEKVSQKYPLRRPGEPEDVAKAIAFLASDDASFGTGVNLKLDGGFCDSLQFVFWITHSMNSILQWNSIIIFGIEFCNRIEFFANYCYYH